MSKLYLFTSTTCTHCPPAKELATKLTVSCDIIEIGKHPEGNRLAANFNLMNVPTFVEEFDDGTFTIHTNNTIKNLYGTKK